MTTLKRTEDLVKFDRDHVIHPMSGYGRTPGIVFDEGHGIMLKDVDGKEYIDFIAGLLCVNLGYGRQEIADAVAKQISKLGYATGFWGFTTKANVECAERLLDFVPKGLTHFLFCSGGSEANESALKISRLYWRSKGQDKYKIIGLYNSYHGLTFGAMSVTGYGHGMLSKGYEPLVPGFLHIPWYHCYRCTFGLTYPSCDTFCARYLGEVIEEERQDSVAAFMAEPVQGSGGMIPPPPTYWPIIRKVCDEHNVLLIVDEVMTGFGRTGKPFAVDHWGVKPDIMTMAKGLTSAYVPMGATAMTDQVYEGISSGFPVFTHGYTYAGHPVASAASAKTLEIMARERSWENAAKQGKYILERLKPCLDFDHVGDIGGLGLMVGIEMVEDKKTKKKFDPAKRVGAEVVSQMRRNGILIREFSDRVGLGPALIASSEDVDRVLNVLIPILKSVK